MIKKNPPLSFDAILGALAVLSIATTGACSKSESAAPAPESNASSRNVNAAAPPTPTAVAVPPATTASAAAAANDPAVDAGKDVPPPSGAAKPTKKAGASCGATGCSPDMKKNGK